MARNESVSQSRQPFKRIIMREKARLSGWVSSRRVTLSTRPRQPGPDASRRAGMTLGGNMISVLTYIAGTYQFSTNQITTLLNGIIESGAHKSNRVSCAQKGRAIAQKWHGPAFSWIMETKG